MDSGRKLFVGIGIVGILLGLQFVGQMAFHPYLIPRIRGWTAGVHEFLGEASHKDLLQIFQSNFDPRDKMRRAENWGDVPVPKMVVQEAAFSWFKLTREFTRARRLLYIHVSISTLLFCAILIVGLKRWGAGKQ